MDKHQILKQYFGHKAFREGQEQLIDSLLSGRDALGIMPTGGGKSMCYQVPALMLPGVTLVVSPLISLMKDQVMALKHAGIPAAYINSSLTPAQLSTVYQRLRAGAYKLVYVAPERLEADGFVSAAQSLDISLLAVDEAHCISQWGQDFRPSYRKIPDFLTKLPRRPVIGAFTATATEAVRRDISAQLGLRTPCTVVTGFDRPNLYFEVQSMTAAEKPTALRALLAERRGKCGIVYCSTRSRVERVCSDLTLHGYNAARYHAGLSDEERAQSQDDFQFDRVQIMVATNAFGMGIDKSNVSFVIHYNMPKCLEAYYQEAGRAGRDGERADCILLFSSGDINTAKFFIDNSNDNEELTPEERVRLRREDLKRLDAMVDYCKTKDCLRTAILDYFGQSHSGQCGNCSNCLTTYRQRDVTREAQMVLSCVRRMENALGVPSGMELLADVLYGSDRAEITNAGLERLSTYGLMRGQSMARIMALIDFLRTDKLLCADADDPGALILTSRAEDVLFHGERVLMPIEAAPGEKKARRQRETLEGEDARLLTALKEVRTRLAKREGVPPYVIFSNATLTDMALRRPQSMGELLDVSGVGEQKQRRYGKAFLAAIAAFCKS